MRNDLLPSDLPLSDEDRSRLSGFLAVTRPMYINGRWTSGSGETQLAVMNPADGSELARVWAAGPADVDAAVAAARHAKATWAATAPAERAAKLWRLAELIERDGEILAVLEVLNQGKPLGLAQALDVGGSADTLRYYAGWPTKLHGITAQLSAPDERLTQIGPSVRTSTTTSVSASWQRSCHGMCHWSWRLPSSDRHCARVARWCSSRHPRRH